MSAEEKDAHDVQKLTEQLRNHARQLFGILHAHEGAIDKHLLELLLTQTTTIVRGLDELKCRQAECMHELEERNSFLHEALSSQRLMLEDYMDFVQKFREPGESGSGMSITN